MDAFESQTLRLKQLLGVTLDKQVAELLGLSPRAWAGRKKASSFPDRELYALAAKRPDLKIDAGYVLRGERMAPGQAALQTRIYEASAGSAALIESAIEANKAGDAVAVVDKAFLAKIEAVLPWCDDDARDLMLRMAHYSSRRGR